MVEQNVFGVEGLYEKRSLEEQCDLSLKVKECKEVVAKKMQSREWLFQLFVAVKTSITEGSFFYKLRHCMRIDCNSIHKHLRQNSLSSQTNRPRAKNLNMESLCYIQINFIQFIKKTVALDTRLLKEHFECETLLHHKIWNRPTNNK